MPDTEINKINKTETYLIETALATSSFRRVWIFDYIKSEIVYVYP